MRFRSAAGKCRRPHGISGNAGFAYIGLLILLAIMGIVSATALQLGKVSHRRAAEEALLDVGSEFSQALESYSRATPTGQPEEPRELRDLLKDPRFPGTKRHLRKLYEDPLTGKPEWGLLHAEDAKRIVGVYSLANGKPIKVGNFDLRFKAFEGLSTYREWVFTREQASVPEQAGVTAASSALVSPLHLQDREEVTPTKELKQTNPSGASSGLISPSELQ